MKTGRPSKRTDELIERLLEHIEEGGTVSSFCRLPATPSHRTIEMWASKDTGLSSRIAQARTIGCERIEEEMLAIADDRDRTDDQDVNHRKLRLWMREKRLIWNQPGKYGTKVAVGGAVDHVLQLSDTERAVRVKQLLDKARGPQITVDEEEETE